MEAAHCGHVECVQLLLDRDAESNLLSAVSLRSEQCLLLSRFPCVKRVWLRGCCMSDVGVLSVFGRCWVCGTWV